MQAATGGKVGQGVPPGPPQILQNSDNIMVLG